MTTTTEIPRPHWIATVVGECAIHGIRETWGAFGATSSEALEELDDTKPALTEGDHELATWDPQVGRVFDLPARMAEEATNERDPVEEAAGAVYAQVEHLSSHDRLLVLRMAIKAEEEDWNADPTTDLCEACAEPIAAGYESPNNDTANGIRFCERCTALEDREAAAEAGAYDQLTTPTEWLAGKAAQAAARARGMIDADLRRVNDQLHNQATGIAKDMTRLLRDLETGVRINELGIVQGSGSDLDRLCAQRHTLIDIKHTLEGSTK